MMKFSPIDDALHDFKRGIPLIVVDDEDRENEGDFVIAAEKITPELVNFLCKEARGLICTPISEKISKKLDLPLMVEKNTSNHCTAFTLSIDSVSCDTGISAYDRFLTIKKLSDPNATSEDFYRPGHIFPLIAKNGGVLERSGHTEASIDLCRLANLNEVAVICEIMNDDGTMARMPELMELGKKFNFKIISIEQLKKHLIERSDVEFISSASLPTEFGQFEINIFKNKFDQEISVLTMGQIKGFSTMVRIHSECLTGDAFGSLRCDCGEQLRESMRKISNHGSGVIIYLRQEGRGIGLSNKIKAYQLQDGGLDTFDANLKLGHDPDSRHYGDAIKILKYFSIDEIELITNNPKKVRAVEDSGIRIKNLIRVVSQKNEFNGHYLQTKIEKFGHIINIQ